MLKARLGLVVPCRHDVIRQGSSHTHTFLLVNGEAVTLHFDVRLQLLLDVLHLGQRLIRVGQLQLEQLDALLQLGHLLSELAVRRVVTSLDFWSLYSVAHQTFTSLRWLLFPCMAARSLGQYWIGRPAANTGERGGRKLVREGKLQLSLDLLASLVSASFKGDALAWILLLTLSMYLSISAISCN